MEAQTADRNINLIGDKTGLDAYVSGVSWSAVLAGAVAAAALAFILLILGVGLGLSAVSPWSYNTVAIGKSTIIWLAFMQLASAGIGGYMAGRLRVKWASVHDDEVYFRDTAHGLLAWAVAMLLTAVLMAGAVRAVLSGAIDASAGAANAMTPALSGAVSENSRSSNSLSSYFADMLLRSDTAMPDADNGALRNEVAKIFVTDLIGGNLTADDHQYLSRVVAKRTGLAPAEAERRVDDVYGRMSKAAAQAQAAAKETADKARKAAAYSALWMFVALLAGAFFASLCATLGGRQRDGFLAVPLS
jgi:hypothetical protein